MSEISHLAAVPGAVLRHNLTDGTWWWSHECYALHGFEVGEVVPSTELVRAHLHPEDRDRWLDALRSGRPGPTYVRVLAADGSTRHVVGFAIRSADVVEASLVDLTAVVRTEGARVATAQIAAATESRATIEQAKGVVAAAHGVDDATAFTMMREASMRSNVSLRRLAEDLVERVTGHGVPVPGLAEVVTAALGGDQGDGVPAA